MKQNEIRASKVLIYLLTYSMEQSPFQKLTGSWLVKKFPAFYGTWRFITALTSARHLSLPSARSIQSKPPHPTYWKSILILSSHLRLGLPRDLLSSGFSIKTLWTWKRLVYPKCRFIATKLRRVVSDVRDISICATWTQLSDHAVLYKLMTVTPERTFRNHCVTGRCTFCVIDGVVKWTNCM
jgi:hypothetical protein